MEDNQAAGIPGIGADGQGDMAPGDDGTGQDFIETDPTGDDNGEQSISIDDYLAELGFKNEDELRGLAKSNKEAQRKITELAQRNSELEKMLNQGVSADTEQQPGAKEASEDTDPDAFLDRLFQDPVRVFEESVEKMVDKRLQAIEQNKSELTATQEKIVSEIESEFFKDMPADDIRLIAAEIETNTYFKGALDSLTPDVFKNNPPELIRDSIIKLLETAKYAALGRNAKSHIEKEVSNAKRSLMRKKGAATVPPTAGGQKTSRGNGSSYAGSFDKMAYLNSLEDDDLRIPQS